ncbi:MerR family transcriptional regulator [Cryobacterium sp.]|jgi:DNA-binding transcriptional MerR regulator|uniref:MerR family transcriptional regulator n=1 Tax=Cryobacterium sp. TaxID=1926290 RepID=UPI002609AE9F|nr:MerR family transcriptional regulator [Cryobacterium sp.]MCU1444876.1 MerR family transcriptional regulator [Cryobacterium sp.]
MKMALLSSSSGIAVATIKYYLREGLLPAGERHGPNQALYGPEHLRRLRVIRGLLDVGGLSIAAAHRVIDAIDSDLGLAHTFEIAQRTVSAEIEPDSVSPASVTRVDELLSGWHVSPDNPGRLAAARVLTTFDDLGQPDLSGWVPGYAAAALAVAEADLDEIDARDDRESKTEMVVIGTVLGDALFAALRRAAQEHVSVQRYSPPSP